ncbi:cell wall / vacuolar inhibitor of fructosidase 1-like [Prosopis cineraria]|uniref:cell wall / vacuolar inhibitor of fructosidase 1-like n=1 Tax=Prosopis cineraria TaxID=364024 RepID=UPI0024107744|nr:cell wall / vacuolar inhibitor of fructosidase 1-like [Prosopis cineraria]
MTNMISQATLIIVFIVATTSLTSPSHCSRIRMVHSENESLIESTCKQTPNYDLCVQSLKSDPSSSEADVAGLGLIMVKVITAKAKATKNKINNLLQGKDLDRKQKGALKSCREMYEMVLETDVPEATEALREGNPKFAEDGVKDIGNEATYCEGEFNGTKSLLKPENEAVRELAWVAVAIVRQLL